MLRPYTDCLHVTGAAGVDNKQLQIGDGEVNFEKVAQMIGKISYTENCQLSNI